MAQRLLDTTEGPIVVVDNASGDDSVATMRRLQSHAQQRLTVVPLRNNLGAVARNIGVAHCDTEYVAFCDDDSWWEPKSIAAAESIFDLHPGSRSLRRAPSCCQGIRRSTDVCACT